MTQTALSKVVLTLFPRMALLYDYAFLFIKVFMKSLGHISFQDFFPCGSVHHPGPEYLNDFLLIDTTLVRTFQVWMNLT